MNQLLQHIKDTIVISDQALTIVSEKIRKEHFAKKEHLLHFDQYSTKLFFTSQGCLRTYVTDFNGVDHNISFSTENWWSGDLQSFLNQEPAICNIQALEDTVVWSVNQENWNFLIQAIPEFVSYTRILFRNKMFSQQHRIVQNLSLTAEERYAYFLKEYPNLSQRISQKHIASYLGITPEFLSMIRSRKSK
ncbi:MAG: Crp/Fnr family transcriptional regulator [Bacteroidota bacterium]